MRQIGHLFWWWLDYLYAGWQQTRAIFRRGQPRAFAEGDSALPALVLLPGVYETWLFLEPLAKRLNARGYRVFAVPELSFNRMPVLRSAEVVAAAITRLADEHGIGQFILLAHSKGGLIGKQLMLSETGTAPVIGMVAIATPFSGSSYAQYFPSSTLQAFSPLDETLKSLLTHENVNADIVSIYPEFDPHIPAKSSLVGATNVELPIAGHFVLLGNSLLGNAVERAVTELEIGRASCRERV